METFAYSESSNTHDAAAPAPESAMTEAQHLAAGYTKAQHALEVAAITTFFGLCGLTVLRICDHLVSYDIANAGWIIGGAVLAGLLFADLSSGLVHWAADNWGHANWPVVGAAFIRPFRLHHVDAQDITRHTFTELNGNNCLVSLVTFWWGDLCSHGSPGSALFFLSFWLSVAVWVLGTNQFHAWAHMDTPPRFVQKLQKVGIVLSKEHHAQHHAPPHNKNYCITTGWMNHPLNAIRFFSTIERIVSAVTGVKPQNHIIAERMRAEG